MDEFGPEPKRRKVRKGTQSCWECRRRKVRCILSSPASQVCDNCARRKTTCISQELCEKPTSSEPAGIEQFATRLGCIEEFIERLNGDTTVAVGPHCMSIIATDVTSPSNPPSDCTVSIPLNTNDEDLTLDCESNSINNAPKTTHPSSANDINKYEVMNRELMVAWPSQNDLSLIRTLPVGLSLQLHLGICMSTHNYTEETSLVGTFQMPPLNSHPILIARQLLLLGTFLQGVLPSTMETMEAQGFSVKHVMHRAVNTAISLVTTKDEFINSVEAIECILLEAHFQNYAGNLRRAWMATRRCISVAQMMAIHRGFDRNVAIRILESETRTRFNLENLNFHLAEFDGYLSVMLGLQRSSLQTRHLTSPKALEACSPMERMRRMNCIIIEHILERTESIDESFSQMQEDDKLLQKAAAEMSPQWWLMPDCAADDNDESKAMHEVLRAMNQMVYYHLLTRLHLPYMLRKSITRQYDSSKATAVIASREIITRFLAFRRSNPAHYYCRGLDFTAFIAATVLSLAYVNYHANNNHTNADTAFGFLAHSRLSDRGLMERTLEVIEAMNESGNDPIASKISRILGHLLTIEASAADGTEYNTNSDITNTEEIECGGRVLDGGRALCIHIPHFGTIKFERGGISKTAKKGHADTLDTQAFNAAVLLAPNCISPGTGAQSEEDFSWTAEEDWDLQGVDIALFGSLFSGYNFAEGVPEESWVS